MTNPNSGESAIINFQPMPKRFMVWDKELNKFSRPMDGFWEVAMLADHHPSDTKRYTICQSTNLFDKDGKEIFEGSIIALGFGIGSPNKAQFREFDERPKNMPLAVVRYNPSTASFQYSWGGRICRIKETTAMSSLVVVGHILLNPELMEEK